MPRPPRMMFAGAVYHVFTRGNHQESIFADDTDRTKWITLMREAKERFGLDILSYCLMTNHIHLAVRTGQPNLDKLMEWLKRSYTRHYNGRHRKWGHLFQGPYKARLVQTDRYLLALVRYIHMNPVKAGMTDSAEEYPWSSHPYYLGEKRDSLVETETALSILTEQLERQRSLYLSFMQQPIPKPEWRLLDQKRNGVLGDPMTAPPVKVDATFGGVEGEKVAGTF